MATTAATLLLERLDDDAGLVTPLPAGDGDETVRKLLVEAAAWTRSAMGRSDVPVIWRTLARNPHYLASTWRKDGAVMASGALPARDKRRVALAVAMAGRARPSSITTPR